MSAAAKCSTEKTLAERLGGARVSARTDLKASRHQFRGQVAYILSDPVTFESHRISARDYLLLSSLRSEQTLKEIFADLCAAGTLTPDKEEPFFRLVIGLQQRGLLTLPMTNSKVLYDQHEARRQRQAKRKLLSFLFLPVPILNPDRLLERTAFIGRLLYSRGTFVLWLLLMSLAAVTLARRWDEFSHPLNDVAILRFWPLLWGCFTGLKVVHEFGHAYACKRFGGHVNDMGFVMVALNPCAYVDCSAAWSFPSKLQRIIVSLGGMYVESIVAAIALLVWNGTPPGLLNSTAHFLVLIAGFVTLVFNLNPLIKFDGYFVLCDLLGVPNLKQRADAQFATLAKRTLLGLRDASPELVRYNPWLLLYSVASSLYKISVMVGMAAMLATRFFVAGMLVGGFYFVSSCGGAIVAACKYLWCASETAPVRFRAVAASVLLLAGAPLGLWLFPLVGGTCIDGSVGKTDEHFVRLRNAGIVCAVSATEGSAVRSGESLFAVENLDVAAKQDRHAADLRQATGRYFTAQTKNATVAAQMLNQVSFQQQQLEKSKQDAASLTIVADRAGTVLQNVSSRQIGQFLPTGSLAAIVGDGPWVIRAIADAEQFVYARPEIGQPVECRLSAFPGRTFRGQVSRVAATGSRVIGAASLTTAAGGDIPVDPKTQTARQSYFEITVTLPDDERLASLRRGMTATVRIGGSYDSLGTYLLRRSLLFWNNLTAT